MKLFDNIFVFDIETDGLFEECTKFWCGVSCFRGETKHYILEEGLYELVKDIKEVSSDGNIIAGHNIIEFDIPALEKLSGSLIKARPLDTLVLSRLLSPERAGGHSLESWGERLGFRKLEHNDFSEYSEEMLRYCERDALLTANLCSRLLSEAGINYGEELDKLPIYRASYRPNSLGTSEVWLAV